MPISGSMPGSKVTKHYFSFLEDVLHLSLSSCCFWTSSTLHFILDFLHGFFSNTLATTIGNNNVINFSVSQKSCNVQQTGQSGCVWTPRILFSIFSGIYELIPAFLMKILKLFAIVMSKSIISWGIWTGNWCLGIIGKTNSSWCDFPSMQLSDISLGQTHQYKVDEL